MCEVPSTGTLDSLELVSRVHSPHLYKVQGNWQLARVALETDRCRKRLTFDNPQSAVRSPQPATPTPTPQRPSVENTLRMYVRLCNAYYYAQCTRSKKKKSKYCELWILRWEVKIMPRNYVSHRHTTHDTWHILFSLLFGLLWEWAMRKATH